jgi:hypothetical protein
MPFELSPRLWKENYKLFQKCHPEPFACHSERHVRRTAFVAVPVSEESLTLKIRDSSVALKRSLRVT